MIPVLHVYLVYPFILKHVETFNEVFYNIMWFPYVATSVYQSQLKSSIKIDGFKRGDPGKFYF